MNATKNGIKNCPHCKAIDEAILEGAFLEAFGLLAGNFDDVLDISHVECGGGFDEERNPDPYKLTFVLKVKQSGTVPNAKEHYKAIQKELKKVNKVS